ncbi:MAG: type II toxin-antitoxin system VapC family toxin, partial [Gemmatimonadaceae bacterium]
AERGTMTVMLLRQMPVTRYAHQPLLPRIWRLRDNLSAYDAAYIALAEALGAPLVTRDTALANATGHRARVDIV